MPEKPARERGAGLRVDARRNLEKLKAAACEAFAEAGLDAPLEDIAARAGVSIGTLYNRLGSREALIDAVVAERAAAVITSAVERAETITDPWGRFACLVEELCAIQANDRAFNDVMARRHPEAKAVCAVCDGARAHVVRYLEQAQRAGVLRPDVTVEDIVLIFLSNANLVSTTDAIAPDAWRRSLAITLDGLRAEAAHPLPSAPANRPTRKTPSARR